MTYGEIIETAQNDDLGRFILGQAVTAAVNLESIAKGARVMIDQEFPPHLWKFDKKIAEKINPLFAPFTNPLDYTDYDEFKWYVFSELSSSMKNLDFSSKQERIAHTKTRLKIANQVRCSPKFNWNSKSKEGLVQIKATINFISENGILDILHNFSWNDVMPKKEDIIADTISRKIDSYEDYRLVPKKVETIWKE